VAEAKLYAAERSLAFIDVFGTQSHEPPRLIELPAPARRLIPDTLHNRLFALCADGTVAVVDCAGDDIAALIPVTSAFLNVTPAAYVETLDRLFIGSAAVTAVWAIDCAGESAVAILRMDSMPVGLCYHAPTNCVYASARKDSNLYVVDAASCAVVDTVLGAGGAAAICSNPVNNRIYVGDLVVEPASGAIVVSIGVEVVSSLTWCSRSNKVYLTGGSF